jgi:hypothetical protein
MKKALVLFLSVVAITIATQAQIADQTLPITGLEHPELISDNLAWRMYLPLLAENAQEGHSARYDAFINNFQLNAQDRLAFILAVDTFNEQYKELVKSYNAKGLSDDTVLYEQMDALVTLTRSKFQATISAAGMEKLSQQIQVEKRHQAISVYDLGLGTLAVQNRRKAEQEGYEVAGLTMPPPGNTGAYVKANYSTSYTDAITLNYGNSDGTFGATIHATTQTTGNTLCNAPYAPNLCSTLKRQPVSALNPHTGGSPQWLYGPVGTGNTWQDYIVSTDFNVTTGTGLAVGDGFNWILAGELGNGPAWEWNPDLMVQLITNWTWEAAEEYTQNLSFGYGPPRVQQPWCYNTANPDLQVVVINGGTAPGFPYYWNFTLLHKLAIYNSQGEINSYQWTGAKNAISWGSVDPSRKYCTYNPI